MTIETYRTAIFLESKTVGGFTGAGHYYLVKRQILDVYDETSGDLISSTEQFDEDDQVIRGITVTVTDLNYKLK